jgi:hypothetical protein
MKKIDRARSTCPPLNEDAQKIFGEVTANFSAQQIDALAQHLLVHNRATKTMQSLQSSPLPVGASVRIISGDAKYVGLTGTVVSAQKLHAVVEIPGVKKKVYIYTSDGEVVGESVAATG